MRGEQLSLFETTNADYHAFVQKFKPKKTTDDCYTPDIVYNAVAEWVKQEYGKDKSLFVRPFWPETDYRDLEYPKGSVVVDNPPFSILSEIIKYYQRRGVFFFLFAPTLTLFSSSSSCTAICVGAKITYDNGACVNTSFITNLEPGIRLRSAPTLYEAVQRADNENQRAIKKELPTYSYPDYVLTATRIAKYSELGIDFAAPVSETAHIRQMDAQKKSGKTIFGSGYLVSERIKGHKEQADKEKIKREREEMDKQDEKTVRRWELSERERRIVQSLGKT